MMVLHGRGWPANAVSYPQLVENWIAAAKKQNAATTAPEVFSERLFYSIGAELPRNVEFEITGDSIVLTRPGKGDRVPGIWLPKAKTAATLVVHPGGAPGGTRVGHLRRGPFLACYRRLPDGRRGGAARPLGPLLPHIQPQRRR